MWHGKPFADDLVGSNIHHAATAIFHGFPADRRVAAPAQYGVSQFTIPRTDAIEVATISRHDFEYEIRLPYRAKVVIAVKSGDADVISVDEQLFVPLSAKSNVV